MTVLEQMNSLPVYLLCGAVILFVLVMSVFFLLRAWKAGIAIGMDKVKLRRAVTSSITFTLLPSISILLGVIALSGSLGVPLPWVRRAEMVRPNAVRTAGENWMAANRRIAGPLSGTDGCILS